jgi:hypothetical protein
VFLETIESRLDIKAHIAALPQPVATHALTEPALNTAARAEALHALAHAFGNAAERLKSAAKATIAVGRQNA